MDNCHIIGHIWPMILTLQDHLTELGEQIRARRVALNLTQQAASIKAGVAYRTWRRMEGEGRASIDDLVRAAIALRCDDGIEALFPAMVARCMDDLLAQQRLAARTSRKPQRASGSRSRKPT